ncbi:MAG: ABC transporter substrate-binding protein, partial [Dehalococcoidia bacterium]
MCGSSFWIKVMGIVLTLALLVPAMAACGGDDGEETATLSATTPAATTPVKTTPATTDLPFVNEPIKIGAVIDYSGPAAMAGVLADRAIAYFEWYFNERQNGIVVGDVRRPVKVIKADNQGTMGGTSTATRKLVMQDKVTAVTMGGSAQAFGYGVADVTDPANTPYFSIFGDPPLFEGYKYTVACFFNPPQRSVLCAKLIVEYLKAKKVAILCYDIDTERAMVKGMKEAIGKLDPEAEIVFEQYPSITTNELSPFLTAMKQKNPDILVTALTQGQESNLAKQIMELGGWGTITHVGLTESANFMGSAKHPGAQGLYFPAVYIPGYDDPGAIEFTKLWTEKFGAEPFANYAIMYNPLVMAARAVELAGSDDPAKVAKAARSGNFEAMTPMGLVKVGTSGMSTNSGFYVLVK